MVEGEVQSARLYFIAPDSPVFPIEPTPENPCWVVKSIVNGHHKVTVIDAVEGGILGYGVPPPFDAFSLTGPEKHTPCSEAWDAYYTDAADWFTLMGYFTEPWSGPMRPRYGAISSRIRRRCSMSWPMAAPVASIAAAPTVTITKRRHGTTLRPGYRTTRRSRSHLSAAVVACATRVTIPFPSSSGKARP